MDPAALAIPAAALALHAGLAALSAKLGRKHAEQVRRAGRPLPAGPALAAALTAQAEHLRALPPFLAAWIAAMLTAGAGIAAVAGSAWVLARGVAAAEAFRGGEERRIGAMLAWGATAVLAAAPIAVVL